MLRITNPAEFKAAFVMPLNMGRQLHEVAQDTTIDAG